MLLGLAVAVRWRRPGEPTPSAPVTITFLRHDNPNYVKADKAFFAEYMAAHPNVTIEDTTVDFRTPGAQPERRSEERPVHLRSGADPALAAVQLRRQPGRRARRTCSPWPRPRTPSSRRRWTARPAAASSRACRSSTTSSTAAWWSTWTSTRPSSRARRPGWADWESFIAEAAALTEYDAAGKPMANGLDIDPDWPAAGQAPLPQPDPAAGRQLLGGRPATASTSTPPEARDSLTEMVELGDERQGHVPGPGPRQEHLRDHAAGRGRHRLRLERLRPSR